MAVTDALPSGAPRVPLLLAAGGAAWEREALAAISGSRQRLVLVKRCLDLTELLATAATGGADLAVASDQLPGLDADSVDRLARDGVRAVVVTTPGTSGRDGGAAAGSAQARLLRMGAAGVLEPAAVGQLARHVEELSTPGPAGGEDQAPPREQPLPEREGRVIAVWGPNGAPGRTTLAIGIASEAARRGETVTLLDADPYGGAVATHLAVLEDVSGLLAATRLANAGELDPAALAGVAREVHRGLRVVTGLPRPDRWTELRPQGLTELLAVARRLDDLVVVDCGFAVPPPTLDPFSDGPVRDETTGLVLEEADLVVAVANADPVGLTRLARALPDLLERCPGAELQVVVNRMRPSLGWSRDEVEELVTGVAPRAQVGFLPEDRAATDRALLSGRTLGEAGDSPLRRGVVELTARLLGGTPAGGARRRGRRRLLRERR
jgi:MinD-like ATPase involved in chromosome partitioning or flagellar assembly